MAEAHLHLHNVDGCGLLSSDDIHGSIAYRSAQITIRKTSSHRTHSAYLTGDLKRVDDRFDQ